MVSLGDMETEIPIAKILYTQKVTILKRNQHEKPVVTATQLLESMIKSPKSARAEATDLANVVLDGTDRVMLSDENATTAYTELAVDTMYSICLMADHGAVFDLVNKAA
jgi:pyruvate kinase